MEANTEAIIRLVWSRLLGLGDDALDGAARGRMSVEDHSMIMFVTLWQHRLLIGPGWLHDRAAGIDDRHLADGPCLLDLGRDHGGRLLGAATLAYTDTYVEHDRLAAAVVTDDAEAVADLERQCPPDDVAEVGLNAMNARCVVLGDQDQVTSGAGYAEWQRLLAHMGVLTPPALRRAGHATVAAALATNDALDSGLVAQWRARTDHAASLALSRRLGYQQVGSQTTVLLGQ